IWPQPSWHSLRLLLQGMGMGRYGEPTLLIGDAAVLLGVSRRTVYYWIKGGRLQTVRTPGGSQRVLLSSIARHLRVELGLPAVEQEPGPAAYAPAGVALATRRDEAS